MFDLTLELVVHITITKLCTEQCTLPMVVMFDLTICGSYF